MKHLSLNSSEADYWDFSFHEKGYYDLAASIDFIIETTGLEKIALIGHSEGTTDAMALTTTRTEYNEKLSLIVMLSPVGYMGGLQSPILLFLVKHLAAVKILVVDVLKINAIPYTEELSNLIVSVCSIDGFTELCNDILKFLCGDNKDETDLVVEINTSDSMGFNCNNFRIIFWFFWHQNLQGPRPKNSCTTDRK